MTRWEFYQQHLHAALCSYLPAVTEQPQRLHAAMHYAVFNGGKRLRPCLVYATGEMLGASLDQLQAPACAVEFIHAYSLIHDDLPAMDDDDWRRGQPACHKAFDEATAILAGDALQTLAFECLASSASNVLSSEQSLAMVHTLATASGSRGMAGGQAIDLAAAGQALSLEQIEALCRLKTGALIDASVRLASIAANQHHPLQVSKPLQQYAEAIGLGFQIRDDILDIEGDMASLGKLPGSDNRHAKPTYAAVVGLPAAKAKVNALRAAALAALNTLNATDSSSLQQLTNTILAPC